MTRRLTERGRERRSQLLEYATRRFAESGYHPTSVAEIVRGVGVGKGVFYWYFDSKEELFLEILREAQRDLRRRQQRAIGDEPDPLRRIEIAIRTAIVWFHQHRELTVLVQFATTEAPFAAAIRRGEEIALADLRGHVKDGIVEGRVRDADPEHLARAVLGVTSHLARSVTTTDPAGADELADATVAFCLGGLRAD